MTEFRFYPFSNGVEETLKQQISLVKYTKDLGNQEERFKFDLQDMDLWILTLSASKEDLKWCLQGCQFQRNTLGHLVSDHGQRLGSPSVISNYN